MNTKNEAPAEPAQPTYRELNQTGALMAVPPGEGSQPEPAPTKGEAP